MAKKKLSIGAQEIGRFYEENFVYVDKTKQIYEMMDMGVHNFIVRPRRFGKSLFLDTVGAIYEGKKEWFTETWIYDKINWETVKRPVLRIDFSSIDSGIDLEKGLVEYLRKISAEKDILLTSTTAKGMFDELIRQMGREKGIVILIDEYEMPVTDYIGVPEKEALLQEHIFLMKKFYGTMKGAGAYIHRSYITGVSKIGQIGILSDLNMLNDLSMHPRFTTLFGYTEAELCQYYPEYITEGAKKHSKTQADFIALIRQHYNGYSWDGIAENRVYNPFSIVNFFQVYRIKNYWFRTGTPTILVRGARQTQMTLKNLEAVEMSEDLLQTANLRAFYSLSLLFQAGYLTIKKVRQLGDEDSYTLGFPNQEVRESFAKYLLAEYIAQPIDFTGQVYAHRLRLRLEDELLREAFEIFPPVIASVPYDIANKTEAFFHAIMHTLLMSTGMLVISEVQNMKGRTDLLCVGEHTIYIFEYKLDKSAEEALLQIHDRGYATPYLLQKKSLYLVGMNFLQKEKKISEILVEKWNGTAFERLTIA